MVGGFERPAPQDAHTGEPRPPGVRQRAKTPSPRQVPLPCRGHDRRGGMSAWEARELAQGIGTALGKRRLEDDEAGSITETRSGHPQHGELNPEEEFRRLDEEL